MEISHHVEVLLRALEQPSSCTDDALEALLFTRFVTAVDAPALALIYPILYRGLRERLSSTKMKALLPALLHSSALHLLLGGSSGGMRTALA